MALLRNRGSTSPDVAAAVLDGVHRCANGALPSKNTSRASKAALQDPRLHPEARRDAQRGRRRRCAPPGRPAERTRAASLRLVLARFTVPHHIASVPSKQTPSCTKFCKSCSSPAARLLRVANTRCLSKTRPDTAADVRGSVKQRLLTCPRSSWAAVL